MSPEQNHASTESRPATPWTPVWLVSAPPQRRARSFAIIFAVVVAIGWLDYLAGFWVSLQLFYLIPILMSVAWLGWRAGVVTATMCVVVRVIGDGAAGIFQHVDPIAVFWNRLAEMFVSWILVWIFHALISLQRELEGRVRQRTASLEQAIAARDELQNQLFEVGRRERSAIGHDLHDGLGQHLTATSMAATLLASRLAAAGQPASAEAQAIVRLLQEGIMKTRQIARGLLLSAIEPDQLVPELEELADTLRKEHPEIACRFTAIGTLRCVNVVVTSHLFYIAQEAARNALRHAKPTRIEIDLLIDDHALDLIVADNGRGVPAAAAGGPGMGLRIMRHRSELIGGEFTLGPGIGGGTLVRCRLPVAKTDAAKPKP